MMTFCHTLKSLGARAVEFRYPVHARPSVMTRARPTFVPICLTLDPGVTVYAIATVCPVYVVYADPVQTGVAQACQPRPAYLRFY